MAAISIKIGKECFIYMNGRLLMKKWISQSRSIVFDIMTYDKNTLKSIKYESI